MKGICIALFSVLLVSACKNPPPPATSGNAPMSTPSENLTKVYQIVDQHVAVIENVLKRIKTAGDDKANLATIEKEFREQAFNLASNEDALFKALDSEGKKKALEYAENKMKPFQAEMDQSFSKIGVQTASSVKRISSKLTASELHPSYAIGFIVCHPKCCRNDAGNGVAVGLGCWDCNDNVHREGCPP